MMQMGRWAWGNMGGGGCCGGVVEMSLGCVLGDYWLCGCEEVWNESMRVTRVS